MMNDKEKEFQRIFATNIVDIENLRRVCYGGIPKKYRAMCWRILLGTQSLNIKNAQRSVEEKNEAYLKRMLGITHTRCDTGTGDTKHYVLTKDRESSTTITCRDQHGEAAFLQTKDVLTNTKVCEKHRYQIDMDVKRLIKSQTTFVKIDVSFVFKNILTVFATRRPAIGYVQGMADLLVPFVHLFCSQDLSTAESSAFYTFCKFIDAVQSNFIDGQPGIYQGFGEVERTLRVADKDIWKKLDDTRVGTQMYAFRWLSCFFIREFSLENAYLIFDSLFAYGDPNRFTVFFSTSVLIFHREAILKGNFEEIVLFLQTLPSVHMDALDMEMLFRLTTFIEKYVEDK